MGEAEAVAYNNALLSSCVTCETFICNVRAICLTLGQPFNGAWKMSTLMECYLLALKSPIHQSPPPLLLLLLRFEDLTESIY